MRFQKDVLVTMLAGYPPTVHPHNCTLYVYNRCFYVSAEICYQRQ
jgi:hypothetical protein